MTHPCQPEKQHEPNDGAKGHCEKTFNGHGISRCVQKANCCEHEQIENEDRGCGILTSIYVAPRNHTSRNIYDAHHYIIYQKRSIHDVSGI